MRVSSNSRLFPLIVVAALLSACAAPGPAPDAAPSPAQQRQSQAQQDYEAALELMKAGEARQAEAALFKLTQGYPEFSGPYANLGILYLRSDRLADAEQAFTKALSLNPNSAVSHNHLGVIYRQQGKFEQARQAYEKALALDANYANAHLNYGILLDIYLGKLTEALAHYKRYQELVPEKDDQVNKWIVDLERRIK